MPQQEEYEVFDTQIAGFSGLCFNANRTGFFAVGDNGSIYEIFMDGSVKRQLPYTGGNDFEAIAINPTTGRLYLADESLMNIYFLSPDEKSLNLVTHISVSGGVSNKGIEGLSFGADTLFIANQEAPTLLIKYALSSEQEVSRNQVAFAQFLSDIFYDASDGTLWICDSRQKKIFHCTTGGEVIASQDISFVPKAEALVVDRTTHTAWVGCDQTSKLYKIKLTI